MVPTIHIPQMYSESPEIRNWDPFFFFFLARSPMLQSIEIHTRWEELKLKYPQMVSLNEAYFLDYLFLRLVSVFFFLQKMLLMLETPERTIRANHAQSCARYQNTIMPENRDALTAPCHAAATLTTNLVVAPIIRWWRRRGTTIKIAGTTIEAVAGITGVSDAKRRSFLGSEEPTADSSAICALVGCIGYFVT